MSELIIVILGIVIALLIGILVVVMVNFNTFKKLSYKRENQLIAEVNSISIQNQEYQVEVMRLNDVISEQDKFIKKYEKVEKVTETAKDFAESIKEGAIKSVNKVKSIINN